MCPPSALSKIKSTIQIAIVYILRDDSLRLTPDFFYVNRMRTIISKRVLRYGGTQYRFKIETAPITRRLIIKIIDWQTAVTRRVTDEEPDKKKKNKN